MPVKKPRAPLKQYNVGAPMERVALDVMGPFPKSKDGNKYILVMGDYFTRWIEAVAIPNQEAVTVAETLIERFVSLFWRTHANSFRPGVQF